MIKFFIYIISLCLLYSANIQSQNKLPIPDTLSRTNFNLIIKNGSRNFYSGYTTNTMGVNEDILGPTLILRKGDIVTLNVKNTLSDTTTIHWHGMHVAPENDGGPHTFILPGSTWSPHFTVLDNASTYWYHPHLHKKTAEHVTKGIAGFIIVRDEEEAKIILPRKYGVDDFPIVIQSRAFDASKQFIVRSELDSVILVNGTKNPYLQVPAQIVRLRLLNGSTERTYNFGLTGNKSFYQIGGDGGLLNAPISRTRLRLAPGERAEILIDFSSLQGQSIYLMSYASELQAGIIGSSSVGMGNSLPDYSNNKLNGANFNILKFDIIAPTQNPITTIPSVLISNSPFSISSVNATRILIFSSISGMMNVSGPFVINGTPFKIDKINYSIPLNNTEIWELRNQTPIAHPFHIHDVQFYLLDRNGTQVPLNERGRKDVVLVESMETVRFITKFQDFSNPTVPYMFHCHLLTHEDDGMMGQFIVTNPTKINENESIFPNKFSLEQNYPNPFNPTTKIKFSLPTNSHVKLTVFDILGKAVYTLINEYKDAGTYEVEFNASNLYTGVYFYQLSANNYVETKKFVLIK
ncbi:multicopper oxidase domain-containing protein [Stygiobacter electus]|uniref:Multicopper oxidase domain-containing protein n=1 Tax=Stygiobacter electus TaxID=3032292 RepID=A0AAE3TD84_9BACT|nr:multicopper oxidase domain-containing protein [Stygiobacter electus]MDF1612271.1 multicopper oxidase domain-containing protein [Stygiobacter electus]